MKQILTRPKTYQKSSSSLLVSPIKRVKKEKYNNYYHNNDSLKLFFGS